MNDNDFATNLGNRIRELRKNKGVSQLELAYDMDMSMNTISGIELGKISPKIDTPRNSTSTYPNFSTSANMRPKTRSSAKKSRKLPANCCRRTRSFWTSSPAISTFL